jgi:hypothetical protein
MTRLSLRCAGTCLALLLLAPDVARATSTWRIEPLATGEDGASAVAADAGGRFAVGDARGASLREPDGVVRRIDLAGAVRDLAFAPDGALWIASAAGLFRYERGRAALRTPAPGESARDVLRVATGAGAVAVASGAGVHWSRDGDRFARVSVAEGEVVVSGLALEPTPDGDARLWIAADRGLFAVTLGAGLAGARAERVPLASDLRPALDVVAADGRVFALGPTQLLAREERGDFRAHRPALPPGSTPLRLAAAAQRIWIATDRGLLGAASPGGPFERAPAPAGAAVAADVAVTPEGVVLVATARGLVTGVGSDEPGAAPAASVVGCDPPVLAVQRAALAYLELRGDPAGAMRRGVRLRGLFPIVSLEGSKSRDRDEGRSYDEAFISGGYHHLYDRDDARSREREVAVRLSWDLGDAVYNPEQIDVSTEARRLVELRDDVLDEVNQLYFDRQRALASRAAAPSDSADALRESLRAAELAAGLDAWTDGWFSARAACGVAP